MFQVKLYQFDKEKLDRLSVEKAFPHEILYYFSGIQNAIGVGFDVNDLRRVTKLADGLGLKPIILTGPRFLKFIESAIINGKQITEVNFTVEIDEEDREELNSLLRSQRLDLVSFLKSQLISNNTFMKNISWYEETDRQVKLSLYDNGILFVNNGIEALSKSDNLLSLAVS